MTGGWLFWIIIGATVLQWVVTKMNEQAALNKAKREREQRRMESLRTGEGLSVQTSTSPTTVAPQSAEIQARRQAQLRALRERQQQRAQRRGAPPTNAQQGPVRRPQRAPRPSQIPAPAQPSTAPSQAQQARARQMQRQQRLAQQRLEQERRQEAERARARARAASATPTLAQPLAVQGLAPAEPFEAGPTAPPVHRELRPRTREEWRRAIIAAEILAPPVSLRG